MVEMETDWEDEELASITKLICDCGKNLLEGYTDYIASHEERIRGPSCEKIYQFIWKGMTIQEITP